MMAAALPFQEYKVAPSRGKDANLDDVAAGWGRRRDLPCGDERPALSCDKGLVIKGLLERLRSARKSQHPTAPA